MSSRVLMLLELLGCFMLASGEMARVRRINRLSLRPRVLASMVGLRGGEEPSSELPMYKALSQDEILERLSTIPVFVITDDKGHPIVFSDTKGESITFVCLQKEMADQVNQRFVSI